MLGTDCFCMALDSVGRILKFLRIFLFQIEHYPIAKRKSIWTRSSTSQSFDTLRTLTTVNSGDFLVGEAAKSVTRTDTDFVSTSFFHVYFLVTLFLVHLPFFVDHGRTIKLWLEAGLITNSLIILYSAMVVIGSLLA